MEEREREGESLTCNTSCAAAVACCAHVQAHTNLEQVSESCVVEVLLRQYNVQEHFCH